MSTVSSWNSGFKMPRNNRTTQTLFTTVGKCKKKQLLGPGNTWWHRRSSHALPRIHIWGVFLSSSLWYCWHWHLYFAMGSGSAFTIASAISQWEVDTMSIFWHWREYDVPYSSLLQSINHSGMVMAPGHGQGWMWPIVCASVPLPKGFWTYRFTILMLQTPCEEVLVRIWGCCETPERYGQQSSWCAKNCAPKGQVPAQQLHLKKRRFWTVGLTLTTHCKKVTKHTFFIRQCHGPFVRFTFLGMLMERR